MEGKVEEEFRIIEGDIQEGKVAIGRKDRGKIEGKTEEIEIKDKKIKAITRKEEKVEGKD